MGLTTGDRLGPYEVTGRIGAGFGVADLDVSHSFVHGLAEVTLILVLFSDAARIDLPGGGHPGRLGQREARRPGGELGLDGGIVRRTGRTRGRRAVLRGGGDHWRQRLHRLGLSGLEYGLHSALVLGAACYYALRFTTQLPPIRDQVALGCLVACVFLSRLDAGLLVVTVVWVASRRRGPGRPDGLGLVALAAPTVAAGLCYVATNWWIFGAPTPLSAAVKRSWSHLALEQDPVYQQAGWLAAMEALPADAILASWNSGTLTSRSERTVVNLDGLVNSWNYHLETRRNLCWYWRGTGVTHLVDFFDFTVDPPMAPILASYRSLYDYRPCAERLRLVWVNEQLLASERIAVFALD